MSKLGIHSALHVQRRDSPYRARTIFTGRRTSYECRAYRAAHHRSEFVNDLASGVTRASALNESIAFRDRARDDAVARGVRYAKIDTHFGFIRGFVGILSATLSLSLYLQGRSLNDPLEPWLILGFRKSLLPIDY